MDLIFAAQTNDLLEIQNKSQNIQNLPMKTKTIDSKQRNDSQITEIVPPLDLTRVDPYFKPEETKVA